MLFCFRVMNSCVLALLGALLLSPVWFSDFSFDRQLAHFLPPSKAVPAAPSGARWAGLDEAGVIARLHDLRAQIRDDLCRRDGNPDFLRARVCGWKAGT